MFEWRRAVAALIRPPLLRLGTGLGGGPGPSSSTRFRLHAARFSTRASLLNPVPLAFFCLLPAGSCVRSGARQALAAAGRSALRFLPVAVTWHVFANVRTLRRWLNFFSNFRSPFCLLTSLCKLWPPLTYSAGVLYVPAFSRAKLQSDC